MDLSKSELKHLRLLSQKKVRDAERSFLVEGWRAIEECLDAGVVPPLVVVDRERLNPERTEWLRRLEGKGISLRYARGRDLESVAATVHSQGIVARVPMRELRWSGRIDPRERLIVLLDRIADPGNLGTILRTCDWFGVRTVLLGAGSVSVYNDKVVRSTVGSLFRLSVYEEVDLPDAVGHLKSQGVRVVAASMEGTSLFDTRPAGGKDALLFGSEAHGIAPELEQAADVRISIPRYGGGESLNVSIAAAIFLSHWKGR